MTWQANSAGASLVRLFIVATLSVGALATTFQVGDDSGWALPSPANNNINYTEWASKHTFVVGDVLHFIYSAAHNVQPLPTGESFAACDLTGAVAIPSFQGGSTDIVLETAGPKWYVCGLFNHCKLQMKFNIDVIEAPAGPGAAPATSMAGGVSTNMPQTGRAAYSPAASPETGGASTFGISRGPALSVVATAALLAIVV